MQVESKALLVRRVCACGAALNRYADPKRKKCWPCLRRDSLAKDAAEANRALLAIKANPRRNTANIDLVGLNGVRVSLKLTWPELARKTGFAVKTLKSWSTSRNRCPAPKARRVAEKLGVAVEELCLESGKGGRIPGRGRPLIAVHDLPGLKRARERVGMTQKELGSECGCSRWMISKLECGAKKASGKLRDMILAVVGDLDD